MATRPRSPNYPAFSLQKAVDYSRKIYAANHLHKATREVIAKAIGYSTLNGGSATAISALKKFGLLEDDGSELRVTKDALTVIAEPASSPERARVLVKLATKPDLFAELQSAYPGPTPSEDILRTWLLRKGFVATTVDIPIRAYRETMELAFAQKELYGEKVGVSGPNEFMKPSEPGTGVAAPEIGDLVQWEVSGLQRFDAPRRVRAIQPLEGDTWIFVDGSETGIPMEEVVLVEKASVPTPQLKEPPFLPMAMSQSGLPGAPAKPAPTEREWLRGPLSRDVSYRLLVVGDVGPREVGKLIKLLEAQKAVLDDDDSDSTGS